MTLQIEQQETESRELKLTVHVDEARVQERIRTVAKKLAKSLRIPGFRPGKAPFHIVQRWVGEEALRGEAVDGLTEDLYKEAIEQVDAQPYAPGSLDDIEMEPLVLHLTVPMEPLVELGDYRQVRVDLPTVEVTDEQVNDAMKAIQEKHALLEPAARPAQEGDVVVANFKAVQNEDVLMERESAELLLDPETLYPDTPFVENVVGMSAGDQKSFETIVTSEEDEEAGAAVTYTVEVLDVKSRYLPPLNDSLAQEEGDFESLLDLRIDVRRQLTEAAQQKADAEYVDQVFDQVREGASVVFPPAAVELEIDDMVRDTEQRFKQQGWALEDFLKFQAKTLESWRDEMRPAAEERVQRSQITLALVRSEKLFLGDDELDQLIEERMGGIGEMEDELRQQLREFYSAGQGRVMMANEMMMNKFTDRIKAIGMGEAPDLSELEELSEEEE